MKIIYTFFKVFNSNKVLKVVAISNAVKNYLINDLGTLEKKIQVIPSATGINIKNYKSNFFKSKRSLNIGYFGSLEKTKGINYDKCIKRCNRSKNGRSGCC